jgi:hypothetical protein
VELPCACAIQASLQRHTRKVHFEIIARKDYLEFFIETILAHRGDPKKLSALQFKVKWLGYNEYMGAMS